MIKQVIVIRRDLKMRRGKEIAQGSHSSMMWLCARLKSLIPPKSFLVRLIWSIKQIFNTKPSFTLEEMEWLNGTFTKITLQVDSEAQLLEIFNKAKEKGLTVFLVTDSGKTEFNGVPTRTCCAIGPNEASKIDEVTRELKLY